MTTYFRVGNQTFTANQLKTLSPVDVEKIEKDAAKADQKRKDNIAESMGLGKQKINLVPDIRPGSELVKALIEDKLSSLKEEGKEVVSSAAAASRRGRPKGSKNKSQKQIESSQQP